jgi:hypothetical protein
MDRWVCLRCYESNDADQVTCTRCGLARGASPSQADPADPGAAMAFPTTPVKKPSLLWGLIRRFGFIAVIAVVAGVGWWFSAGRGDSGEITRSGNMDITELRAGDCFDLQDPNDEVVEEVNAKVCTEAHEYEVVHVVDMPGGAYPTADAMDTFAYDNCVPAFGTYVGVSYQESVYEMTPVTPTEDGWGQGDHTIQCVAYDPNNTELTASVQGANR